MKRILVFVTLCLMSCSKSGDPIPGEGNSEDTNVLARICSVTPLQEEVMEESSVSTSEVDTNYENYIVKFREDTEPIVGLQPSGHPVREYSVKEFRLTSLQGGNTYSLNLKTSGEEKKKFLESLQNQANVEYIEPDYPIQSIIDDQEEGAESGSAAVVNDPYFSSQWFHRKVNSLGAWNLNEGAKDIVVAVVDTGIDYTHPDLKNNMWKNPGEIAGNRKDDDGNGYIDDIYGWNYVSNNADPRTSSKSIHGSHVAGIIGASGHNGIGIIGMAPQVKLMALRFLGETGTGMTSSAIKGINYAVDKKVFLINNSWGSGSYSKALFEAITRARKANVLFFAAAGNGRSGVGYNIDSSAWYPASYKSSNVFSVAASTSQDQLTKFSNYSVRKVDVAAPGYSIYSTVTGAGYKYLSGTSMATPLVSGLAVLVKVANRSLTADQVMSLLRESVDPIVSMKNKIMSGGRVNAFKAVSLATASKGVNGCLP